MTAPVVVSVTGADDACIFDGYILSHKIHVERSATGSSLRLWGQDPTCVMNVEDIPHVFAEAFYIATTGRPGPVWIDIPKDVQQGNCKPVFPEKMRAKSERAALSSVMLTRGCRIA